MSERAAAALRILALPTGKPIVCLCRDEVEAEGLAATLAALASARPVVHLPSSDQLPSDEAPASPANVGARLAALRRLRTIAGEASEPAVIVVTSGEAAARRYLSPDVFDDQPPNLARGDAVEPGAFCALAKGLGYIEDDIVDEAGEVCLRGAVVDIFPADAGAPVRLEIDEGIVTALSHYDPASQLSTDQIDAISVGRASEPDGDRTATLLDHR